MRNSTTMRTGLANFYPDKVYGSNRYLVSAREDVTSEFVTTEVAPCEFASLTIGGSFQPFAPQISEAESEPYPFVMMMFGNTVRRDDTTPASGETLLRRAVWTLSVKDAVPDNKPARVSAWRGFGLDEVGVCELTASGLRRAYSATRSRLRRLTIPKGSTSQVPEVVTPFSPAVAAHLAYLDRMADRAVVSRQLADFAKVVWHAVEVATGNALAVPAASAVEGGPIRYTWRHAGQWLTVTISEGGLCEWTYLHSVNDELWGEDSTASAAPSTELKTYMSRLVG